jgi:hypothetical protein
MEAVMLTTMHKTVTWLLSRPYSIANWFRKAFVEALAVQPQRSIARYA